jgi:hypothetical protein
VVIYTRKGAQELLALRIKDLGDEAKVLRKMKDEAGALEAEAQALSIEAGHAFRLGEINRALELEGRAREKRLAAHRARFSARLESA